MPIETFEDIIEGLADNFGVFGAHGDELKDGDVTCTPQRPCRMCWTESLESRLRAAFDVERRLSTFPATIRYAGRGKPRCFVCDGNPCHCDEEISADMPDSPVIPDSSQTSLQQIYQIAERALAEPPEIGAARMTDPPTKDLAEKLVDWLMAQKYQGEDILHAAVCCDYAGHRHFVDAVAKQIDMYAAQATPEPARQLDTREREMELALRNCRMLPPMTERSDAENTKLAATLAMGWAVHVRNTAHWTDAADRLICDYKLRASVWAWNPLESIADAWMLVDRMRELGWLYAIRQLGTGEVAAQFWKSGTDPHTCELSGESVSDTAPRAITLAAISAMEKETT